MIRRPLLTGPAGAALPPQAAPPEAHCPATERRARPKCRKVSGGGNFTHIEHPPQCYGRGKLVGFRGDRLCLVLASCASESGGSWVRTPAPDACVPERDFQGLAGREAKRTRWRPKGPSRPRSRPQGGMLPLNRSLVPFWRTRKEPPAGQANQISFSRKVKPGTSLAPAASRRAGKTPRPAYPQTEGCLWLRLAEMATGPTVSPGRSRRPITTKRWLLVWP